MKSKARKLLTFFFAAVHLLANIVSSAAYAAGDTQSAANKLNNLLPGDGSVKGDTAPKPNPSGQPASDYKPPLSRSMKSVDTIKVPSPSVTPHDWKSFEAVEARATGDVSKALDNLHLTPAQRLSVRNYIGQYDDKVRVVAGVEANGVQTLGIKDAKSGEFVGAVTLRHAPDGSIEVNKAVAASLDTKKTVEIPLVGKVDPEEARKVLGGSKQWDQLNTEERNPAKLSVSLPALNAEAGADLAKARQSTAVFHPDGSGYEYGLTTKVASGKAEGKLGATAERTSEAGSGFAGVEAGAGAKGPEVEGFINYFGKPDVNKDGKFTRSVIGGTFEVHSTLAEVEAKLGCSSEEGCGSKLSAGAFGVGTGGSVNFSTHMDIPVKPLDEVEEGGVAAPEQTAPEAPVAPAEEKAYQAAVADGSPEALKSFLEEYPNSEKADEVLNKMDLGAAGEPLGLCDDESTSGSNCGRVGY